ncbi:MAG TPA: DUF86 domain-containing protein [Syntrophorhabdaceae bacterium]|jgi:uncharacterized protein with HEPN domain
MTREYGFFLRDILKAIDDIGKFIAHMDYAAFLEDEKTKSAVVWKITNIGEAAKNIPQSVRSRHRSVPWKDMARMRDKIAHLYFGIDYALVWGVATKELPEIKPEIEKIFQDSHDAGPHGGNHM